MSDVTLIELCPNAPKPFSANLDPAQLTGLQQHVHCGQTDGQFFGYLPGRQETMMSWLLSSRAHAD